MSVVVMTSPLISTPESSATLTLKDRDRNNTLVCSLYRGLGEKDTHRSITHGYVHREEYGFQEDLQ